MKTMRMMAVAVLIVGSGLALHAASAQQPGTKRTDLQRHDLSAPGREVVQVRVDFDPGYVVPEAHASGRRDHLCPRRHAGVSDRRQAAVTVKPGDVLFVPAGTIHSAKNVGSEQRGGAGDVCRRKREAAHHAGEVSASE